MNVGISTFRIFIMYVFISDMLPTLYHYKTTTPMFSVPFRPSLDQNILISKNKTAPDFPQRRFNHEYYFCILTK